MDLEKLRYPIGRPQSKPFNFANKDQAMQTIQAFPKNLRAITEGLAEDQLNTPYRPDGWKIKQVVHHCADSHMNALIRFKWALTEASPTIKAYEEAEWAKLADYAAGIELSLQSLDLLHQKWAILLHNMSDQDFERTYLHPEGNVTWHLSKVLFHYEWHCNHHFAHIANKIKTENW